MSEVGRHLPLASVALGIALGICNAGSAFGQTNERLYEGLDFRFVTPGARAVGMGITFVGLADDATAAASNPAGLSNLRRPEFSVETFRSKTSQEYLVRSQLPPDCDGPCNVHKTFGETAWLVPSFASFAMPLGDFSIAAFTNSEQDVRRDFQLEGRCIAPVATDIGVLPQFCQTAETGHLDVSVRNYGVGGAWLVHRRLSIGGSYVLSHLQLESSGLNGPGSNQGPEQPDCPHNPVRSETDTSASELQSAFFAGALYKPARGLSVGLGYYGGMTFRMSTRICGTFATRSNANGAHVDIMVPTDYVVPGRISVGVAYKPVDHWTLLGEVARINYSSLLTDNFQIVDFRFSGRDLSKADYNITDVNEYHSGVEYQWLSGSHVMAVRGGAFSSSSHSLKFIPGKLEGSDAAEYFQFNTNAPKYMHVGGTAGFGMTFGNKLQVDGAVSALQGSFTVVVSVVRRIL